MVDSHDVISQLCWAEGGPVVDLAGDGGGARHGHPYLADVGALGPAGLGQGALPMTAEVEAEPDEDGGQARLAGDGWGGSRSAGVEIAAPEDPVADLSALAAQGESTWLEYKRQLPSDSKESKRTVLKTVVAFANGEGGTLLFGVDGDDETGQIVGVPGDAPELQRRVNDLLRALITPTPPSTVSAHDIEGKCVIRVDTVANQGILYALVVDANRPEYYVRRNGSTYFARREELAALVKPAPSAGPFGFMGLG